MVKADETQLVHRDGPCGSATVRALRQCTQPCPLLLPSGPPFATLFLAPLKNQVVQGIQVGHVRNGNTRMAADVTNAVFDAAFFVWFTGTAEFAVEQVVGT